MSSKLFKREVEDRQGARWIRGEGGWGVEGTSLRRSEDLYTRQGRQATWFVLSVKSHELKEL